jgi:predicted ATPase/DNA-binding CsgD family transcriptional regulator
LARPTTDHLSRREREVAALVADGLTNRDIANRLFISDRTVEGHVQRILDKLGFQRRSQIAVWTREDVQFDHPGNLPVRVTTFVGREAELEALRGLLVERRLLTIVGPGGIGKTRLALELAASGTYRDGAWFVDLAPLSSGERVWDVTAAALGVRESATEPLADTVLRHLARRESLILFDNCEHVVEAVAATVEAMLGRCVNVRVVATSREPLSVYGETAWRTPPLRQEDAVVLFNERARLVAPSAAVGNGHVIADVVGRLDRLPLAIELAAARVRVLSPTRILELLDDAFALLTGGPRTIAPRQRTLEATVDWSYDLLDAAQKRLFQRLSVFAGGFDLAAAEAVDGAPVLDHLTGLVDRSLVEVEAIGDTMRYRLLEILRQYGQARLAAAGEAEEISRRHAEHYLDVASRTDGELRLGDRGRWLPLMRLERDNFRVALDWAAGRPGDFGLRLATHLARFWTQDGWAREESAWMERALAVETPDPSLMATALHRAGELAYLQGDYEAAWSRLEESLAIKRRLGDAPGAARRLNLLSIIAMARGERATAQRLGAEALEIAEVLGETRGVGWANLSLGYTAFLAGDAAEAGVCFHRALAIHRQLADPIGIVFDLSGLIWLDLEAGDLVRARAKLREGLTVLEGLHGMRGERGWLLSGMVLAEAEGRDQSALRLAGAIDATERGGLQPMAVIRARYQPVVDRAEERVGPPDASRLMAEGAAMSEDELLQEILPAP